MIRHTFAVHRPTSTPSCACGLDANHPLHVASAPALTCPKCGAGSGNDWSQCQGSCPITISPHFGKTLSAKPTCPACAVSYPCDEHVPF